MAGIPNQRGPPAPLPPYPLEDEADALNQQRPPVAQPTVGLGQPTATLAPRVAKPCSFQEFYQDEAKDPCTENYSRIMHNKYYPNLKRFKHSLHRRLKNVFN